MKSELIGTKPGESNFHLFESLPSRLYPTDSLRLKQSDTINHDFLHTCIVTVVNDQPVARLALYNNPHLSYKDKKAACIGNFECINDVKIASRIILHAEKIARETLQVQYLIGPMNGSSWDNYRFSRHHDYPSFFLEPDHHLYYNDLFLNSGFHSIANYVSSIDTQLESDDVNILQRENELMEGGVIFRQIDMNKYEEELKGIYQLSIKAFRNNFLYTPITWENFKTKYLAAAKFMNPEHVLLAEDKYKNIIGFIFCIDDLYNKKEKSLIIKTLARINSKEWGGLGYVLANKITRLAVREGYQSVIHAFMIEQAVSTTISSKLTGKVYKNYTLYGKEI